MNHLSLLTSKVCKPLVETKNTRLWSHFCQIPLQLQSQLCLLRFQLTGRTPSLSIWAISVLVSLYLNSFALLDMMQLGQQTPLLESMKYSLN